MNRTVRAFTIAAFLALFLAAPAAANHRGEKHDNSHQPVTLCHKTGAGYKLITVDDSAEQAHLDHGDLPPGADGLCPAAVTPEEPETPTEPEAPANPPAGPIDPPAAPEAPAAPPVAPDAPAEPALVERQEGPGATETTEPASLPAHEHETSAEANVTSMPSTGSGPGAKPEILAAGIAAWATLAGLAGTAALAVRRIPNHQ